METLLTLIGEPMDQKYLEALTSAYSSFGINISSLTTAWLDTFRKEERYRGRKTAIALMKDLNTIGERIALSKPIKPLPYRKSNRQGIPRELYVFRRYLTGTPLQKGAALSVLRAVELLRNPISKDIESVTDPSTADPEVVDNLCDFSAKWVKGLGLKLNLRPLKYHHTLRNGPNGPALASSDLDVGAVLNDSELFGAIQTIQTKLGDMFPLKESFRSTSGGIHSKLTQFPEKAGKTRTIAVIDYYSQRALKPLHKGLMSILRSMVSDGTYNHNSVGLYAKEATESKDFIACFDLTAFTDRFPAKIQYALLHALLEEETDLADAFWTLLAKRQFTVAWSGEQVTYECGQPMGAYASWPLCSLAHHMLVEYCYKGPGGPKEKYRLIGDDVIITDKPMAQEYVRKTKSLGISINLGKTVISKAQSDDAYSVMAAEVAKQLYYKGSSITPITPGLLKSLRNPMLVNTALKDLSFKLNIQVSAFPPGLMRKLLPKKESLHKALLLCTNPLTGTLRRDQISGDSALGVELLQDYHRGWAAFELDEVKETFYDIRYEALMHMAASSPIGMVFLPMPNEIESGPVRLTDTEPLEAQAYSSLEILRDLTQAADILEELMYDDYDDFDEDDEEAVSRFDKLQEVEYLADQNAPFQDRKATRDIRRSQIILEVAKQLEWTVPVTSTC